MGGGSEMTAESTMQRQCYCDVEAPLETSWTANNPGRRFYRCGRYKIDGKRGCNFFEWHDNEWSEREKKLIKGLLRKLEDKQKREKLLFVVIVVSWFIIGVLILKL